MLQDLNEAEDAVGGGAIRGSLSINASLPFGTLFVVPAIPAFLARHPDVVVDLSFTDDLVNLLAQKADIAIRAGALLDSALVARRLGQSRRVVCASPAYLRRKGTPKVPGALRQHDCLRFNFRRSRTSWPFREKGREIDVQIAGSALVNNGETMRQLTLAGCGVARLGYWHVAADIERGELVPLLERFNAGDVEVISAVRVAGRHVAPRVRAFIEHMVEQVAASPLFTTR